MTIESNVDNIDRPRDNGALRTDKYMQHQKIRSSISIASASVSASASILTSASVAILIAQTVEKRPNAMGVFVAEYF